MPHLLAIIDALLSLPDGCLSDEFMSELEQAAEALTEPEPEEDDF